MSAISTDRLIKLDQRALIINDTQEILLVRDDEDSWDLPGGVMQDGENWREALEDLIAELLDLQIVANNPIYASDFLNPTTGEYIYVSFVAANAFGNSNLNPEKYAEVKWFTRAELGALKFATYEIKDAIASYYQHS